MSFIQKAVTRLRANEVAARAEVEKRRKPKPRVPERKPLLRSDTIVERPDNPSRSARVDVDMEQIEKDGYLSPESVRNSLAEEYRRIKRPLLSMAFGAHKDNVADGNLIMVTSALPGDGKTFTAINLALSMCKELDRTVLLVDADLAKAHLSRIFGVNHRPGLLDVLVEDELGLSDVMLRLNVPGRLSFLPAGRKNVHATELLASEKMGEILRDLAARYPDRIILFDSPPILATTEAQVLSSLVGQIVMIVNAQATPQHAVLRAVETLDASKAISVVLNKSRASSRAYYYDGYYGDD